MQNFLPKLREHILPRIQGILRQEVAQPEHSGFGTAPDTIPAPFPDLDACASIFLKNDRIYQHRLMRFHFTTYDVRRGTDIINPSTFHHNIMLLTGDADASDGSTKTHHFLYARVLGAYHVNVVYTGPGMRDYNARRLDFLWVRWYEVEDSSSSGWYSLKLDRIHFPPLDREAAFGFVDPKDVLRGCHVMPVFAKGKKHPDGVGISRCARDGRDYHQYYVGR
jgi:hypothetical protein